MHRTLGPDTDLAQINAIAFIGLLAYIVLAIMRFQEYTWVHLDAPIIPVVEMLMLLAWAISAKPPGFTRHLPVLLLIAVYFISSLSAGAEYAVTVTQNYVFNIAVVYVVLAQVAVDARRADAVMGVFCTCMATIGVQCILMSLHPDHMGWTGLQAWERLDTEPRIWQVRYIGTLGDPNDLGMTLLAAIPMAAYLSTNSTNSLLRLYYAACLGIVLYTIYLLNSRGTILGLLAILGGWGVLRFGVAKALVVGLIALPLALAFAPSRFNESGMDRSALDRIDSWYNGMKMFTANPFFGVGKDQYLQHHYKVSHNSWIEQVAEFGMIGYLLWNRIVLGALLDAFQMFRADERVRLAAAAESEEREKARRQRVRAGLPEAESALAQEPGPAERLLQQIPASEVARTKALLLSIAGILVTIFFIDRSDSLITFLVCALIAGTLTRYEHNRTEIDWLPVSFWVYLGAFVALVVVYVAIQVFVLT